MATSVMPAASAMRTASAVGAETATMQRRADRGRLLHHLDRDAAGQQHDALAATMPCLRQRAGELVERVVAADILAQRDDAARRRPERGGVDGTGFDVEQLQRRQRRHRRHDLAAARRRGRGRRSRAGRTASAMNSTPHRPQPVGPAIWRRRSRAGRRGLRSHIRSSMPASTLDDLEARSRRRRDDAFGSG